MKITDNIGLIEYTQRQEILNSLTHAAGAVFAVTGLVLCLARVSGKGPVAVLSAALYCCSFIAVYTASALYHGLPDGNAKRLLRLIDHISIPVLLAGTTTPCALITLYRVSHIHGIAVFAAGWFCALFGAVAVLGVLGPAGALGDAAQRPAPSREHKQNRLFASVRRMPSIHSGSGILQARNKTAVVSRRLSRLCARGKHDAFLRHL